MCSVEETRCSVDYDGYCLNGGVCCHSEFTIEPFCMSVSFSISVVQQTNRPFLSEKCRSLFSLRLFSLVILPFYRATLC